MEDKLRREDKQFMIECLTKDLAIMLMEDYGYDAWQALNVIYNSHTYQKLENERTGLYYQSPIYVYDFLNHEMKFGD